MSETPEIAPKPGVTLRIVGDGTPEGTFVETLAGERLDHVGRIEFACAVGQAPIKARITLDAVEVDIITPAEVREVVSRGTVEDGK